MERKKILLVDDSNVMRRMIKQLFADKPYDVITAVDGRDGMAKARAWRPDLILMDIVMPGMSGLEACAELRRADATREIPIIMLTTRGEQQNLESGYLNGCNDYIVKCADGSEVIEKVEDFLGA